MNAKRNPAISVIMVDGSFRERFHAIDFFDPQTFDNFELLWVEYYDRISPLLQRRAARCSRVRMLTLGREGTYHSSYCFNTGILASAADLLVIVDGDVAVERDFLQKIWQEHSTNEKLVMYVHRYNEPKEHHAPDVNLEHLKKVCRLTNPQNYGGCLSVRKQWLLTINGYEQHPVFSHGEHANGRDVYTRLKNLGLHIAWHPELRLYHPWHSGTLVSAASYRLQGVIVDYRAVTLATSPFQGIDSSRNCVPSPEVLTRIEAETARIAAAQVGSESARADRAGASRKSLFSRAWGRARRTASALWG